MATGRSTLILVSSVVLFCLPVVLAASQYQIVSDATRLSSGVNASCQNLDPYCLDSDYSGITDVFTVLSDGSTSTTSATTVRNASNTQSSYLRLLYFIEGLYSGDYYLRVGHISSTSAYNGRVCMYNADLSSVNVSSCVDFYYPGGVWGDVNITDLVRSSFNVHNYGIYLRYYVLDGSQSVSEIYLKRPISPADFAIVPQGVTVAEIDTRVENTWAIVASTELPEISDYSCDFYRLNSLDNESDTLLINSSLLNVVYDVSSEAGYFNVYWDVNDSVDGVDEGYNYAVVCSGYVGSLLVSDMSQYVYINRERSIIIYLESFVIWVLQILGIVQNTEALVSGSVSVPDVQAFQGQQAKLVAFVNYADDLVSNASCSVDVWDPASFGVVVGQSMVNASDGRYLYQFVPEQLGGYSVRVACLINDRTFYDTASLQVISYTRMEMVS